MFLFTEPRLVREVICAHHRGVSVRVLLNPPRTSVPHRNEETFRALSAAGVSTKWTGPEFMVTHEKSMVVDERAAFVQSLNWAPRHFAETRDHCIITVDPAEVREVVSCFDADWDRRIFDDGENALLIWCNGNARMRLARFIDRAKHYLFLQNERFVDIWLLDRLFRANDRNVKIRIIAGPHSSLSGGKICEGGLGLHLLYSAGIKVRELKRPSPHSKIMLADGKRAIVGSINLTPGTLEGRRDLAIEVDDIDIVTGIESVFLQDWHNARRYNLSHKPMIRRLLKYAARTEPPWA
jgi:phosphatidylserine/phosphatidylglycerophosphate/cardiolipin synthase-like enzyme